MKKLRKIALAAFLFLPVSVFAEGMVGTAVLLDTLGVYNAYYQHKLSNKGNVVFAVGNISGSYLGSTVSATSFAVSYKGYLDKYADGGYWQIGGSTINVSAGSLAVTGFQPLAVVGYEKTLGTSFVLGGEIGYGTGGGWGYLGLNAAFKF